MSEKKLTCKWCAGGIIDLPCVYRCWYFCSERCWSHYQRFREGQPTDWFAGDRDEETDDDAKRVRAD